MDKRNFLFVSLAGLISDIAWQVAKEGHDVKYFIKDEKERDIADGFVLKVSDWEREIDWADAIVFDDTLGQGEQAQALRAKGKLDLAAGINPKLKVKSGFQIGVRIVVSPFPFDDDATFQSVSKNAAILFKKGIPEEVHIEDVKQVNGQWYVAGTSGVVLVVCGLGQTLRQAQAQAYSRIRNIMIPDMYYRDDIGERWFEDHDKLHTWGYLREV